MPGTVMSVATREILKFTISLLSGFQAVILTMPISYFLAPRPDWPDGCGAAGTIAFVAFLSFVPVFVYVPILLAGYRETMDARLKRTVLTLVVSVGTAYAIGKHRMWWAVGLSAAVLFAGMVWSFEETRKSATG